jgi:hypothetical protein
MKLDEELSAAIEATGARVRFGYPWWLRVMLFKDVVGIAIGRRIYISAHYSTRAPEDVGRLLRHELAHVRQVRALGLPRFLWRYLVEYVGNLKSGLSQSEAYRQISFEREAEAAERVDSCVF